MIFDDNDNRRFIKGRMPYRAMAIPFDYEKNDKDGVEVHACIMPENFYPDEGINEAFFPVKQYRLFWEDDQSLQRVDNAYHYECEDRFAVVSVDTHHVFTTVTAGYFLILHQEAFELQNVVANFVFGKSNEPMIPRLDVLTSFGAACEISLRRRIERNQPEILNGWHAIVKMGNSYNKTKQLSYTLGFEFGDEGGTLLFPDYSIHVKDPHSKPLGAVKREILNKLQKTDEGNAIKLMEAEFVKLIETLKSRTMSIENMLRLFCKVYKPQGTKTAKFNELDYVYDLIQSYINRWPKNAYLMLLVFGQYVRDRYGRGFGKDMQEEQLLLGKWASNFAAEINDPQFSFHNYFGSEISDLVSDYMGEK